MFEEPEWVEAAPAIVGLRPVTTQVQAATAPPVKVSSPAPGYLKSFKEAKSILPGSCWVEGEPEMLSFIRMVRELVMI